MRWKTPLQDSFDELDEQPWMVQLYAQDETDWSSYLKTLRDYILPRAWQRLP